MSCGECGGSAALFRDPADGKLYCRRCWVRFYKSAPPTESAEQPHKEGVWCVLASKKGGLPVAIEKRNKGKKVTVISNVEGDCKALLSVLKKALGCGGVVSQLTNSVEVQGEYLAVVEAFLIRSGCVKGVSKTVARQHVPVESKTQPTAPKRIKPGPDMPKTSREVKKMKPAEMKAILKLKCLSTQGTRTELQNRLLELL